VGKLSSLVEGKLIAFDSAALIYYIEENPESLAVADELFDALDRESTRGMTSVLTLQEVLVKPLRDGRTDLADQYLDILTKSRNITLYVIDQAVCESAARLRARYGWLRTPDALQVATAIEHRAQMIVTNDDRWRKLIEIEVAVLRNFLQ